MTNTVQTVATSTFVRQWQAWHREHERRTGDRHGFLAVTSLNWLTPDPQRFPDAPGEWSSDADGVHVELADGEELLVDGTLITRRHDFGIIPERDSVNVGWGDVVIEVAKRGGFDIVR